MARKGKAKQGKVSTDYDEMAKKRQPYLDRGRAYSALTIPYIMPEEGTNASSQVSHGFQSLGSECVNTFSNKFVNTLFPIGAPFFSLDIDEFDMSDEELSAYSKHKPKMLTLFVQVTLRAMKRFNKMAFRDRLVMYAKHLMITGNACLVMLEDRVKMIGLDKYVTKRDCSGMLIKGIIKEKYDITTLPDSVADLIRSERAHATETEVTIFTVYKRLNREEFLVKQVTDEDVVIVENIVKENKTSVIFGRWNSIDGEDYGRGHCEDYSGDLSMYNFLAEYKAKGAATMMDVKYLVRPGAMTDVKKLNESPPGTFIRGLKDDIVPVELAKFSDGQLIQDVMNEYKERLSSAFLLMRGVVRDSERTTKYEIQQSVEDLESARAGIYSNQSAELQVPISGFLLDVYNSKLLDSGIEPVIDTGLAAIGKASDLDRLRRYTELMALPATWLPQLQQDLHSERYDKFCSSLLSLDTSQFFKTAEEKSAAEDNTLDNSAAESLGNGMASGIGKAVGENMMEG